VSGLGPVVRVQLEGMRVTLLNHLTDMRGDFAEACKRELEHALTEEALLTEMRTQIRHVVAAEVAGCVRSVVADVVYSQELKLRELGKEIAARVVDEMRELGVKR
jgi:dTDP-4-dehydrorhamnose 3,5-epimerase-like enzyme